MYIIKDHCVCISGIVNDLEVKVSGTCPLMFLPLHRTCSLSNTKEPTFISTERALMEREADLSRGMELACFYSNLCKWACLHSAGFSCEVGSQTCHSIEPWGPKCGLQYFSSTWN